MSGDQRPRSYGIEDHERYGIDRLPEDANRFQIDQEPPPTPPQPISQAERIEVERSACRVLGIPHPLDIEQGQVRELHHYLGTFRIADSEGATLAAVRAFRSIIHHPFFSFNEYHASLRKIDSLKKKYRYELSDREQKFCDGHTVDRYNANLNGYINYLADAAQELYGILKQPLAVHIPEEPRKTHTYLLGTTGSGKSELLKSLIYSYATQPKSASVVVIEPSGDFVEQVAHWPEFAANRRLVYLKLDLRKGMVPTINPLQISGLDPLDTSREAVARKQVVAQQLLGALEGVFAERQGGNLTINMRAILMSCLLVLLEKPGATLRDLQRFMDTDQNADLVAFGASRTHFPSASEFFAGSFNDDSFSVTRRSIFTKMQTLFDISFFSELTCGQSTIDLEQLLNERKIILVDLAKGRLGNDASATFGRLLVATVQAIAVRRSEVAQSDRVPIHLIVDECHNFLSSTVEEILTESRKYGLYLTLCQQNVGYKMAKEMTKIVTGNTTVKVAGKVEPAHWERTARQFPIDEAAMKRLSRSQRKGVFYIRAGSNHEPFRFSARSDLVGFGHRCSADMWKITRGSQVRAYYRAIDETQETAPESRPSSEASPISKRKLRLE